MIAVIIVLSVIVILLILRVGVIAEYDDNVFSVDAYLGFIVIHLLPVQKKKSVKIKAKHAKEHVKTKGGKLIDFRKQLPAIMKALSKFKRKLLIKELKVYYMAAGNDAAATALSFGAASAAFGFLTPLLENNFRIKTSDLRTTVSFEVSEPYVYIKARLSLAIWEILYIATGLILQIIRSTPKRAKIRKAV